MSITTASLHDVWGKKGKPGEIQVRMDKKVVVAFPYDDSAQQKSAVVNATNYVKDAIKKGAALKLKPGVEEHVK